jgi:hypothetical protein
MEQFVKEKRHVCLVDTSTNRNPTVESKTITWYCGAKRLVVSTSEIFNGKYKGKITSIQELLMIEDAGHLK